MVFITEIKSVYCAVRTGSLNKAACASYLIVPKAPIVTDITYIIIIIIIIIKLAGFKPIAFLNALVILTPRLVKHSTPLC